MRVANQRKTRTTDSTRLQRLLPPKGRHRLSLHVLGDQRLLCHGDSRGGHGRDEHVSNVWAEPASADHKGIPVESGAALGPGTRPDQGSKV